MSWHLVQLLLLKFWTTIFSVVQPLPVSERRWSFHCPVRWLWLSSQASPCRLVLFQGSREGAPSSRLGKTIPTDDVFIVQGAVEPSAI